MHNVIDFTTRKRLSEVPETEQAKPDREKTAKLIEMELKANDIITGALSESALDAAMELLGVMENSIVMHGAREILVLMKVKGVWTYRWVNMNCPAGEFVEAVRPIWDGAQKALKQEEENG